MYALLIHRIARVHVHIFNVIVGDIGLSIILENSFIDQASRVLNRENLRHASISMHIIWVNGY